MNKRLITAGILILTVCALGKLIFCAFSRIKVDDFHKSAVIFVLDTSSNNQKNLTEQKAYIRSLCAILDPEDAIKILKTDKSSYLIYEGAPSDISGMKKAFEQYTKPESAQTSYGEGIKKAVEHALTMKKNGYRPSVVVIGELENNGEASKQINWDTLPDNISKTKKYIPEFAMMFVYAPPEKLDTVKSKLNPVLGENKLIIANSANIDKANRRFLQAIGR